MNTKKSSYLIPTREPPEPNGNGHSGGSLSYAKRAELWRQFTAHLIGLATVIWWMVYKEAPPK